MIPVTSGGGAKQNEALDADRSTLIAAVRARQRENEVGRLQWHHYCDTRAGGVRDPRKHSAVALAAFLEDDGLPSDVEELQARTRDEKSLKSGASGKTVCQRPVVDHAEAAAARARASAANAEDILEHLPATWRQLYETQAKLTYDVATYDFVGLVRDMLDCPADLPLDRLHEAARPAGYEPPCPPLRQGMLLAGMPLAPERTLDKSRTRTKRDWKSSPLYERLIVLYGRLLREQVLPSLARAARDQGKFHAVVQASPVLRVAMPSAHAATKRHRDAEYGHLPEEINYWLPLSRVWGSNSLFAESFPGRGDFQAFEGSAGDMFRWWGNRCSHYAEPNATGVTRVSLDFRVIPRRFWDAAEASGTLAETADAWTSWHGGSMRLGSYYWPESAATAAGADAAGDDIC